MLLSANVRGKFTFFGENGEKLPFVKLIPGNWDGKRVRLMLSGTGKDCLDSEECRNLLASGSAVVSGDLFLTGESASCTVDVSGSAGDNAYYTTFNYTADALRAQDAALLIRVSAEMGEELTLSADGCAARAAVCALALCDSVKSAKLDGSALALSSDDEYYRDFFIPGILALGGLKGCLDLVRCETELF